MMNHPQRTDRQVIGDAPAIGPSRPQWDAAPGLLLAHFEHDAEPVTTRLHRLAIHR
jgi:hypothetical protein